MKNIPIPDKPLKTDAAIRTYHEELIFNALAWLKIDGYIFYVLLPGDHGFIERENAGACISVEYPYKKFKVSIQKDSLDKCKSAKLSETGYWHNVEMSIFHECVHIILWKLGELARRRFTTPDDMTDADEEATDHITHIVCEQVREARKRKKK